MPIGSDDLTAIDEVLSAQPGDAQVFGDLRKRLPHLSWTRCDASDVIETPFRTYSQFDIHLLDAADHCVRITSDLAQATGIILAKRSTHA
ncbi:hypothetical protein [Hyphomicrobium sp. MC1]|uniref:hypothetical protein n=1 Tax=Hyphomicrobium sp. (strain MC1) TaxID=717785 RepID=UPI000213D61E|nr:hypothetical protein [Hyphomicrobium sp. MC1]CCB66869.1 conserved protein of unknown function [Hyphomicrobium sp. MC1]